MSGGNVRGSRAGPTVSGEPGSAWPMAMLPATRANVMVGPPLLASVVLRMETSALGDVPSLVAVIPVPVGATFELVLGLPGRLGALTEKITVGNVRDAAIQFVRCVKCAVGRIPRDDVVEQTQRSLAENAAAAPVRHVPRNRAEVQGCAKAVVIDDRTAVIGGVGRERAVFHDQRARVGDGAAGAEVADLNARVPGEGALVYGEASLVEDPSPRLSLAVRDGQL